jgi:hypothetical protein
MILTLCILPIVCGATMIVAGLALLHMHARYRLAARVYAVVGLITAGAANWESVRILADGALSFREMDSIFAHIVLLTVAFLLPLTTLVLLRRSDRIPTAQAVFRAPASDAGA